MFDLDATKFLYAMLFLEYDEDLSKVNGRKLFQLRKHLWFPYSFTYQPIHYRQYIYIYLFIYLSIFEYLKKFGSTATNLEKNLFQNFPPTSND